MTENQKLRLLFFLDELKKLSLQCNIEIGGCGDCGSPWLYDMVNKEEIGQHLLFNEELKAYTFFLDRSSQRVMFSDKHGGKLIEARV